MEPLYTTLPYLPITPPPQHINFDALKASIHASLIQDQTTLWKMLPMTTMMPMTQPRMMTTKNTNKTTNTLRCDPLVIASTAKEPQQWTKSTADIVDDANDNFLMLLLTMTIPTTIPMTMNTNRPKKTMTGDPLATDFTPTNSTH